MGKGKGRHMKMETWERGAKARMESVKWESDAELEKSKMKAERC